MRLGSLEQQDYLSDWCLMPKLMKLKLLRVRFSKVILSLGILASSVASAPLVSAESAKPIAQNHSDLQLELIASGFDIPWGMSFLSSTTLLINERAGRLSLLDLESLKRISIAGLPEVLADGQGGLLDIAVSPNYVGQGWIYFTYSKPIDDGDAAATTLARARLEGQRLIDWQDLLVTDSATDSGQHFGSRIAFDHQGHIFFGVGDRGERDQAQNLSNHMGSILRLNLDGSLPSDNPFIGVDSARAEIWSYGHRNPQGLAFDWQQKQLWSIEHGPRGGDEINLIEKGQNYGWPIISYGKEYWGPFSIGEGTHKKGLQQPVKVYIPSIAPGSLIVYRGEAFAEWQGNLFAGALKLKHLNRVEISADNQAVAEERLLIDLDERVRAMVQSPEGHLLISTDSGKIIRILPRR